MPVERQRRAAIKRAVRRGQQLASPADAGLAVQYATSEQLNLRRARWGYCVVGVMAAAGIVAGLLGLRELIIPSIVLFEFIVVAFIYYLPRLRSNLEQAEARNRALAERLDDGPSASPLE